MRALSTSELNVSLHRERSLGKRIIFTNGVFDLLHPGHLRYLKKARALGDVLVVGLNSDNSVRRNKGNNRPILPENERVKLVAALEMVDYVTVFEEDTPFELITAIQPDVLVKGGDYHLHDIVGRDAVEARGGKVLTIPFEEGFSSSEIIERILLAQR